MEARGIFQAGNMRTSLARALLIALAVGGGQASHADNGLAPEAAELSAAPQESEQLPSDNGRRFAVYGTLLGLIVAGVLVGIALARRGHALPIREIPGLSAFDEAVARATEMGRPALFTTGGVCDPRRVQLYASMPLLRRVAALSGELGNRLIVPVAYPETLPVHANATRDGYIDAGALADYRADDVRYFPGGQFFFAIATMGWMLKEQPAACFYFGWWEADSLMLAETGQTINALQIAGTDQLLQVPFFVVTCDYTIIGEEFWASSAKMSGEPGLLGSLGAQDLFKLTLVALMVAGLLLSQHAGFTARVAALKSLLG
jgi:hypothetical protein